MAGTVREVGSESPLLDDLPRGVIDSGAADHLAASGGLPNDRDRPVARVADRRPDTSRLLARRPHRGHPRLVGIDAAVFLRPQIDEQNLADANLARVSRRRL